MLRHPLLLLLALAAAAQGAPPAPPPPASYVVDIRYSIEAFGPDRPRQYDKMMEDFRAAGFRRDPRERVADTEPSDVTATRMRGTVPAKGVPALLRQRAVQALRLVPLDHELPAAAKPVRVDLQLASGYGAAEQRSLARQTAGVLTDLGFVEGVGYDHRNNTRLVGSIPAGKLDALLEDLRKAPEAAGQPAPFRSVSPIRVVTALPGMALPDARQPAPKVPKGQEKFTPDLRALLGAAAAGTPTRLEVVLAATPAPRDRGWFKPLAQPGLVIEGRLGPLVSVRGVPKEIAPALAKLDEVAAVRLPRVAQPSRGEAGGKAEKWEPLKASGVARLHALGKGGAGTRAAVVAADFGGWEALKGRKLDGARLPDPVLIDLTAERNPDLRPDPFPPPTAARPLGAGTLCARDFLRAAPKAELTLIRIDPRRPYMLEAAARAINGERYDTISLNQRLQEMADDKASIDTRRDRLLEARRAVLDEFPKDLDAALELVVQQKAEKGRLTLAQIQKLPEFDKLGPAARRRVLYKLDQARFDADEASYKARVVRYLAFDRAVKKVKGIRLVANSLVWSDGYPTDGSSALSRYFDERPFRAALWFQAAGDTRGQAWTGMFRDADGDEVMEFAAPKSRLPSGGWTRELNFLGWRPDAGKPVRDVPAGARLRVTLQWREAHDPLPLRLGEDPYRDPLASLRVVVLHQPDPDGKKRPADDLKVVAESVGRPQRLAQTLNSATYEQVVELRLAEGGRYALRVEGKPPESTLPPGEARLPATRKVGELHLRLFVQTLSGGGRAVFSHFVTEGGTVGMPADARHVITVGAAGADGKAGPASAGGPPYGVALRAKPDVLAYAEGDTAAAACFAAGVEATARSAGGSLLPGHRAGAVLRVPEVWPRR